MQKNRKLMQISVFLTLIVLLGFTLNLAPALAAPCKDICFGCYQVYKTPFIESKEVKLYTDHGVKYYKHQERNCRPWTKQKDCVKQTYCSTNKKCETGGWVFFALCWFREKLFGLGYNVHLSCTLRKLESNLE